VEGYLKTLIPKLDGANDLKDEQVERILSRLKPAIRKLLSIKFLLPYLQRWRVLMESEEEHLKADVYEPSEQVDPKACELRPRHLTASQMHTLQFL
jgi:hypothetical protein